MQTNHWLFSVDSVAVSELCRSSPRLRTTRSSDRPNYKRREGIKFNTASPSLYHHAGEIALNQNDSTAVLLSETGQRSDNHEWRLCAFLLAQQQNT